MEEKFFDERRELYSNDIESIAQTLIGFDDRYQTLKNHLQMILAPEKMEKWASQFHQKNLPMCNLMSSRHPLFLFSGDVGTGKTVTAECVANRLTKEIGKEGILLKLGSQVRGRGLHGEMTQKVRDAFEELKAAAGKKRLAFLIIDEADAVASLRDTEQMHQEEKSAINTLIQRIDEIRNIGGRAAVFLCTNRAHVLDQAIVRRVALHLEFNRPSDGERLELLKRDLKGLDLSEGNIKTLASMTGAQDGKVGYTYSDFRLRLYPNAVASVFPDNPLTFEQLKKSIENVAPSPEIK